MLPPLNLPVMPLAAVGMIAPSPDEPRSRSPKCTPWFERHNRYERMQPLSYENLGADTDPYRIAAVAIVENAYFAETERCPPAEYVLSARADATDPRSGVLFKHIDADVGSVGQIFQQLATGKEGGDVLGEGVNNVFYSDVKLEADALALELVNNMNNGTALSKVAIRVPKFDENKKFIDSVNDQAISELYMTCWAAEKSVGPPVLAVAPLRSDGFRKFVYVFDDTFLDLAQFAHRLDDNQKNLNQIQRMCESFVATMRGAAAMGALLLDLKPSNMVAKQVNANTTIVRAIDFDGQFSCVVLPDVVSNKCVLFLNLLSFCNCAMISSTSAAHPTAGTAQLYTTAARELGTAWAALRADGDAMGGLCGSLLDTNLPTSKEQLQKRHDAYNSPDLRSILYMNAALFSQTTVELVLTVLYHYNKESEQVLNDFFSNVNKWTETNYRLANFIDAAVFVLLKRANLSLPQMQIDRMQDPPVATVSANDKLRTGRVSFDFFGVDDNLLTASGAFVHDYAAISSHDANKALAE